MSRGALNVSFGWLFSIIAGAFILFLAIFMTTKLIGNEQTTIDLKTGKEIGVLMNPLETGFSSAVSTLISLPAETRISTKCEEEGSFGYQVINLSQKSLGKWTSGEEVRFKNKYIFSENPEGKKFYVFSKPFEFPFKVSDLIYLTSSEEVYCFSNAPEEIKDEINFLKQNNFLTENCPQNAIRICFDNSGCDIRVNYDGRFVEKDGERVEFETDALMYAAIFSSKEDYECQIKRLMKRVSNLANLYNQKADFIEKRECNSYLDWDSLRSSAENLRSSSGLSSVKNIAEEIESKNNVAECKLF